MERNVPAVQLDEACEKQEGRCTYKDGRIRCPLLSLIDALEKKTVKG